VATSNATAKPAAKTKAPSAGTKLPDALKKLKTDHDAVRKLFQTYDKKKDDMSAADKRAMVGTICMELTVHARIEEEIFYPALRKVAPDGLDELLNEALVEHASAKDLIAQLESASPKEELYDAWVNVLGEQIEHHAGEEEKEMFPEARKTDVDLEALGERLAARADELKADYKPGRPAPN
jgi:hemerythrin superfamily protein